MIPIPGGVQVWLCAGYTDMRKSFDGLAMVVQQTLQANPHDPGNLFVFRGRRGDRIKVLWHDGTGLCLFAKRLETGLFVWPQAQEGAVHLSSGQLSILLEGIDWRHPKKPRVPLLAG